MPSNLDIYLSDDINHDVLLFAQDNSEEEDMTPPQEEVYYKGISLFPYKNRNKFIMLLNAKSCPHNPASFILCYMYI